MNSIIFEKVNVLHETTEEFKINVKLLHVFKDYEGKINLFLVTNDDIVYCFGNNYNGLLGFGHKEEIIELTVNEDLSYKKIIEFDNSYCHTIARNLDGKLYLWGYNESGVLGNGIEDNQIYKLDLNNYLLNQRITEICCGAYHTLVLTASEEAYAWGSNDAGQIGNGSYDNVSEPFNVAESVREKVKAIACGLNHSILLTLNGNVYSWGNNYYGELGIGNREDSSLPKLIALDKNIVINKISCGSEHSLLLSSEGDIYVFGNNKHKRLGIRTDEIYLRIPMKVDQSQKFTEIASHPCYKFLLALPENSLYHVWGDCGSNEIVTEPNVSKFSTLNEFFAHSFGITNKTLNKLEEFSKDLFSLKNKKCEDLFGTQISEKEIISSGSFGVVLKVSKKFSNNFYAVKKIPFIESNKLRVCEEAKILVKTMSPFIVKCFDFWIEDNYYIGDETISRSTSISDTVKDLIDNGQQTLLLHIQMELCLTTLKNFMKKLDIELNSHFKDMRISTSFSISIGIFLEILESLDFLHKQKIIHRDIKPSNFLISGEMNDRFIKLSDLGLAVIHESDDKTHSQCTGSWNYMAPEVRETRKYGMKADIYSLGMILKELFGNKNFDLITDNQIMSKQFVLKDLITRMTKELPDLRPDCKEILGLKESWFLGLNEVIEGKRIIIDRNLNKFPEIDNYHLYYIQRKIINSVEFVELSEKGFIIA